MIVVNPVKVILYDANGVAMAVENGVAVPANTRALLVAGSDGTNARHLRIKPASTVPVAADPAAVVVISPNQQPIPITANPAGAVAGLAVGEIVTSAVTNVALRKTVYTEPTVNAQRSISSANASDAAAGTGARTIRITYLTATFTGPFTEDITLNGVTPVATVATNICYIESIKVLTAGSVGTSVGVISLFVNSVGGGGTIGSIAAGDTDTMWAHHYVPTGKTCSVTGVTGNNTNSSNSTLLSIRVKDLSIAASVERMMSDTLQVGGAVGQTVRPYGTPISVVGPARITLFGAPSGTPIITNRGGLDFYDQ